MLGAVVLANKADVDIGARQDPWLIGSSEEDVTSLLDAFEDPAIGAATDPLCREQAGTEEAEESAAVTALRPRKPSGRSQAGVHVERLFCFRRIQPDADAINAQLQAELY